MTTVLFRILRMTAWVLMAWPTLEPLRGEDGPLPRFELQGIALHPKDLEYTPTDQLIHPAIIKTSGRIEKPLGRYYLYYAPHKHVATSMAYSDSLEGPWTEYPGNPVVEGPAAPEVRWIEEHGQFFMWGHRKNSQTELWTSEDGIHFEYDSVSIRASDTGTRNATYNRVYEYPLEQFGSRYIMLYSGFIEGREIRCVWLAHSRDAKNWTPVKTPLVEPVEGDNDNLYGPSLLRWKGRNFVVFQDMTSWRGGNLKYVELDQELTPIGDGGKRYVLIDPPSEPPLNNRIRGAEFYLEGETLYLYSSAAKDPRLIVWAKAEVGQDSGIPRSWGESVEAVASPSRPMVSEGAAQTEGKKKTEKTDSQDSISLDDVLSGAELETVYETRFDQPIRMIREEELIEDGKYVRSPGEGVDWVLEGPAEISVKDGRMHIKNDPSGNCVLWNTRSFPEDFVAEWDFQHVHPQGTAILFFAAHAPTGGSIFSPGLGRRGGSFGNYTRGDILSYHTSYTATDEKGIPRWASHLKKNVANREKGNIRGIKGLAPIDGKTVKPYLVRVAKIDSRVILEIDGRVCFDWTDPGEQGVDPFEGGQIGFRQMRHTLEGSYGHFRVQRIKMPANR